MNKKEEVINKVSRKKTEQIRSLDVKNWTIATALTIMRELNDNPYINISEKKHKKKRGNPSFIAHPALLGSRIAFQPRISNAGAHAVVYQTGYFGLPVCRDAMYLRLYGFKHNEACPNREYTNLWALAIALPCGWRIEFARFKRAADKTLTQRLFIMHVAHLPPFRDSGQTTVQK